MSVDATQKETVDRSLLAAAARAWSVEESLSADIQQAIAEHRALGFRLESILDRVKSEEEFVIAADKNGQRKT